MTDWSDRLARIVETAVAVYNRHDTTTAAPIPDEPVLFVANHGFGGVFDLNVVAFGIAHRASGDDRPVIALTHQVAWQIGVGRLLEPFGARPASRKTADDALAEGKHVLVFPGGDVDAFKSWKDRNTVMFAGRTGFARLAMEAGVPIVPVVTSGGGESVVALHGGAALAKTTGARERFRLSRLPVTLSIPWGINIGMVGLLPYVPLPTKLHTTFLPAMRPQPDEDVKDYAERVRATMQAELDHQTRHRLPIIG
ncbi:lysophospholipid acyltransferase family protein [Gordonia sp. (in: high G+C Gram-positive bacteria)]|uniref:lysophospholipid acyltransferase family protein n=1 Tax=Gordonia sp. (in: high G+C Gram-positive bacteria) TaxID=84139 RepID=UPI0026345610|nr:lysophospholipid acyltransferase family protein [Gordonia sp. (in: high G+C Gram-positive bacteria)]